MNEQEEFEFRYRLEKERGAKPIPEKTFGEKMGRQVLNAGAGALRGAGSIGATVMRVLPNAIGGDTADENAQRRKDMDSALGSMGADTDSLAYGGGKLAAEIAGTAGAGGVLAKGVSAIPGAAAVAPNLINAIRTSGMTAGSGNAITNALLRATGGAVTGGATAGLVNPEDAGTGAAIGGALPGVVQIAGKAGSAVGGALRGPAQTPDMVSAVTKARGAGYVIPPTQANPTMVNRVMEGFAGKLTTAQNASARNQTVTNKLAAESIGLASDAKITPEVLNDVRKVAGQAYEAIGNAGTITPGKAYSDALDTILAPHLKAAQGFPNAKQSPVIDIVESLRSPSFDAASAVAQIKQLRTGADDAFRKGDTDIARASKGAAKALEDAIEAHLQTTGATDVLQAFRDARQMIAKTYSVEKALNVTTGSVDAKKLAAQLAKGKPLSAGLKDAAEFAQRFPKAAQALEGMGSLPQSSPLDWAASGGMAAASGNPLMLAGVAARPAARAAVLSPMVQNRLIQKPNALRQLVSPELAQFGYRAAPVTLAQ